MAKNALSRASCIVDVFPRLKASFDGVQRVDHKVKRKSSGRAGLLNVETNVSYFS